MRWDRLFAELEAEADELAVRDRDAEIADRTRAELGRTRWADRLRAAAGDVRVRLLGGVVLAGRVGHVGDDWLLLGTESHDVLVPGHAVVGIEGLGIAAAPRADGTVPHTWTAAWRVLARDRAAVRVARVDGSEVRGVPVRVGADFVELDQGLAGPRDGVGGAEGTATVLVPYPAVTAAYVPRGDEP